MKRIVPAIVVGMLLLTLSGCTAIGSGFQTGALPAEGDFQAKNGIDFQFKELSLASLPAPQSKMESQGDLRQLAMSARRSDYVLAKGDVVNIMLVAYPEITPFATVNSNNPNEMGLVIDQQGYIRFPLVGRVLAAGYTVPDFTARLAKSLSKYLTHPDPQVKVVLYRGSKFYIDGEVKTPGQYSLTDEPITLHSALTMAGGLTDKGDAERVTLIRNNQTYNLGLVGLQALGISPSEFYIKNGDTLRIGNVSRNKMYVVGELGKSEPIVIPEQGLTLSNVLGEASGLNPTSANAAKIYVLRDEPKEQKSYIYHIDMKTITNFALANRFEMRPNDVVYVDATGLTRWSRVMNLLLLPVASTVSTISTVKGL